MKKTHRRTLIVILAVSSVILTVASAFSVSYSKWVSDESKTYLSLSIGKWAYYDFDSLTDEEIKNLLGGESGIVTSSGQVIKFDENGECTVTLAPGEQFYLLAGDVVISTELWGSTLLGSSITNPDNIVADKKTFTATDGGTYTVSYEQRKILGLPYTKINIEENKN